MLHTTEVMAIFVIFWPILAKIWLPWQRPLDPFNQKCLLWIEHKLYLKTKLCMDMSLTTEVMAIFVIFWPILAQIWLPWQRSLDPCNQKCLLCIGRPRKPPVISNHILTISHRNAFICIYSNFSPKIGCHGNSPLFLVYGSVKDEFPDCINPISKPNSVWICRLQLKLWPFL